MQREEIEEIVRQVIQKMNQIDNQEEKQSDDDVALENIDLQIEMVRKYHITLQSAIAAVIPNEEPHSAVLDELNRWLEIAKAAQIGRLRHERHAIFPYNEFQVALISNDADMLEHPSDIETLRLYVSEQASFPEELQQIDDAVENDNSTENRNLSFFTPVRTSVIASLSLVGLIEFFVRYFAK